MSDLTIFLDDGGVMNDDRRRYSEWLRLLGEFFPPRLGGAADEWSEANAAIVPGIWEHAMLEQARTGLIDTYRAWSRKYQLDWLRTMAAHVGVSPPRDDDEALTIAVEAAQYVTRRCRSAFADAHDAIRGLAAAGFALNTASGEESAELRGYLASMEVGEHFDNLFGPDLVNAFKAGPVYYERAFALAGLAPSRCIVVDDSPEALAWAAAAGARTVLVDRDGSKRQAFDGGLVVDTLAGLLPLAEKMEAGLQ